MFKKEANEEIPQSLILKSLEILRSDKDSLRDEINALEGRMNSYGFKAKSLLPQEAQVTFSRISQIYEEHVVPHYQDRNYVIDDDNFLSNNPSDKLIRFWRKIGEVMDVQPYTPANMALLSVNEMLPINLYEILKNNTRGLDQLQKAFDSSMGNLLKKMHKPKKLSKSK